MIIAIPLALPTNFDVRRPMASSDEGESEASSTHRDLLHTAVREGYFKVPRETSLVELANQRGISDREYSERMRSEIDTLVRETTSEE